MHYRSGQDPLENLVNVGESAQLAPSSGFYMVSNAILGCRNFKVKVNFMMISLKSYKSVDLTSFLD